MKNSGENYSSSCSRKEEVHASIVSWDNFQKQNKREVTTFHFTSIIKQQKWRNIHKENMNETNEWWKS